MSRARVLRIYHSGVVEEYRKREHALRANHGYDVRLVCPPRWPEGGSLVEVTADPEVPVHVVETLGRVHPILFWYSGPTMRALLRDFRPDIVDLQEEPYSLAVAGVLRAVRQEAPGARVCIYSAQNIYKRYPPPFRQLERRALRAADAAYPCSTEAAGVLRTKGFVGAVHVLPLGVSDPGKPPDRSATAELRVGFLGRLEPYKGAMLATRAFAQAVGTLDASIEFLGSGSEEREIADLADRLGISDRVRLAGAVSQDEALRRIGAYDIVVIPSLTTKRWKEQFGRVAAQAMAAGTPVIASDSGSLPEVIGDAGEIFREGDVQDLAEKLGGLLADPSRRRALANLGRRRAAARFTWERVAAGCDVMYQQLLAL